MVFWSQNSLIDKQVKHNILTAKKYLIIPTQILNNISTADAFCQACVGLSDGAKFLNFSFVGFCECGTKFVSSVS